MAGISIPDGGALWWGRYGLDAVTTGSDLPPGVILAGGAGTRIGGRKAFAELGGRPLAAHVIDRLAPQVSRLALNTGDAGLSVFGLPLLPDAIPDRGPLGGILAAMDWARAMGAETVLTAAVDTPFLPADLASRLVSAGAVAAYAETAQGPQATTGLWSVGLAPGLREALDGGTRKVRVWTAGIGAVPVRFDHADAFLNVNTPEDLRAATERLRDEGL
jgi:molybdopterin-guanine dinucleotide biosynthesis protein A